MSAEQLLAEIQALWTESRAPKISREVQRTIYREISARAEQYRMTTDPPRASPTLAASPR